MTKKNVVKNRVCETVKVPENVDGELTKNIDQAIIDEIRKCHEEWLRLNMAPEQIAEEIRAKNQECGWKLSNEQIDAALAELTRLSEIGQETQQISPSSMFITKLLEELVSDFFCDEFGEPYVVIMPHEVKKFLPIKSLEFEELIRALHWEEFKKSIPGPLLKEIKDCFSAMAKFDDDSLGKIELSNRIAMSGDKIIYSLGDTSWQAVEISEDGWKIINEPPYFRKYTHQKPQVIPISGGDASAILDYLSIENENSRLLVLVYLIVCFHPEIAKPLLVLFGPQGSGKSTTAAVIKKINDPSQVTLNDFPNSKKELTQILHQSYMSVFDNLSRITDSQSDTLCRAVTGGGFQKRKLYTDSESIIFKFKRCIVINGIECMAKRSDLLDRSILIGIQRLTEEKCVSERALMKSFNEKLPSILGGIFDVLSKAKKIEHTLQLDSHPRMADFARWGYAIAEALGVGGEKFIKAYYENIEGHNRQVVEDNQVTLSLIQFIKTIPEMKWTGLVSELLDNMNKSNEISGTFISQKEWPKTPSHLSREINKVKVNLEGVGIKYETQKVSTGHKISIEYIPVELPSLASQESVELKKPIIEPPKEVIIEADGTGSNKIEPEKPTVLKEPAKMSKLHVAEGSDGDDGNKPKKVMVA